MSEPFNTEVPIKDELRKNLIFGLEARPPIGIILGLANDRSQVMPLLQKISHGTRAFMVNADGLPGFMLEFDIIQYLKQANAAGKLENAKKF